MFLTPQKQGVLTWRDEMVEEASTVSRSLS